MYIQERDDLEYDNPKFEEIIQTDSLMIKEINIQNEIIQCHSQIQNITNTNVHTLLRLQGNNGSLNLLS